MYNINNTVYIIYNIIIGIPTIINYMRKHTILFYLLLHNILQNRIKYILHI